MWKPVIVATTVLAIAGSSVVYAQQRFAIDGYGDGLRFAQRYHHLSLEDRAAFVDARIAALKAGLELTPDQAKNWPAFEQALRDMRQLRAQRRAAREAQKERFKKLARMLRPHHHYMHARFEERRDGRDRYGYGRDGEGARPVGGHTIIVSSRGRQPVAGVVHSCAKLILLSIWPMIRAAGCTDFP